VISGLLFFISISGVFTIQLYPGFVSIIAYEEGSEGIVSANLNVAERFDQFDFTMVFSLNSSGGHFAYENYREWNNLPIKPQFCVIETINIIPTIVPPVFSEKLTDAVVNGASVEIWTTTNGDLWVIQLDETVNLYRPLLYVQQDSYYGIELKQAAPIMPNPSDFVPPEGCYVPVASSIEGPMESIPDTFVVEMPFGQVGSSLIANDALNNFTVTKITYNSLSLKQLQRGNNQYIVVEAYDLTPPFCTEFPLITPLYTPPDLFLRGQLYLNNEFVHVYEEKSMQIEYLFAGRYWFLKNDSTPAVWRGNQVTMFSTNPDPSLFDIPTNCIQAPKLEQLDSHGPNIPIPSFSMVAQRTTISPYTGKIEEEIHYYYDATTGNLRVDQSPNTFIIQPNGGYIIYNFTSTMVTPPPCYYYNQSIPWIISAQWSIPQFTQQIGQATFGGQPVSIWYTAEGNIWYLDIHSYPVFYLTQTAAHKVTSFQLGTPPAGTFDVPSACAITN
jgi:hypothetical protein